MKNSIIDEIYLSNERFSEQIVSNEEYKKISDKALKFYKQLTGVLNDEQNRVFEDFVNTEMDVCAKAELLHFKEGVKVGLLLAMECLI